MTRSEKDWDEEFQNLISSAEGLSDNTLPSDTSSVDDGTVTQEDAARITGSDERTDHQPHLDDAGDLSKPGNQRCIAVILTPVQDVADLSALLSIHGVETQVMQTEMGAIIYQEYEVTAADAFEELLGDERPIPPEAIELVKLVSSMMSYYGAILCVSWLSDDADEQSQLCGQLVAKRYVNKKFDANLPAGQLISGIYSIVEDLLLGLVTPDELRGISRTNRASALQALMYLRKRLRKRYRSDQAPFLDEDNVDPRDDMGGESQTDDEPDTKEQP